MADHKGFASEKEARERAVADMPDKHVYIIESRGQFYVETEDDSFGGFLRSWERECYHGLGRDATKLLSERAAKNLGLDPKKAYADTLKGRKAVRS